MIRQPQIPTSPATKYYVDEAVKKIFLYYHNTRPNNNYIDKLSLSGAILSDRSHFSWNFMTEELTILKAGLYSIDLRILYYTKGKKNATEFLLQYVINS